LYIGDAAGCAISLANETFEYVLVEVLKIPTFDVWVGVNITFPDGS
jgi:hypothetical protein